MISVLLTDRRITDKRAGGKQIAFARLQSGEMERVRHGVSAACGLFVLWVAVFNYGGLDNGRHSINQQLLQATGLERDSVHGAFASYKRSAKCSAYLSSSGAAGDRNVADCEH